MKNFLKKEIEEAVHHNEWDKVELLSKSLGGEHLPDTIAHYLFLTTKENDWDKLRHIIRNCEDSVLRKALGESLEHFSKKFAYIPQLVDYFTADTFNKAMEVLSEEGVDLNAQYKDMTILGMICKWPRRWDPEKAEGVIRLGADVNVKSRFLDKTPLVLVCNDGRGDSQVLQRTAVIQKQLFKILLDHGADVNERDEHKQSLFNHARRRIMQYQSFEPFMKVQDRMYPDIYAEFTSLMQ